MSRDLLRLRAGKSRSSVYPFKAGYTSIVVAWCYNLFEENAMLCWGKCIVVLFFLRFEENAIVCWGKCIVVLSFLRFEVARKVDLNVLIVLKVFVRPNVYALASQKPSAGVSRMLTHTHLFL